MKLWTEPLASERDDLFRDQAQSFLSAAIGQEPPLCTFDDGMRALAVNLAALRSGERRTVEAIQLGDVGIGQEKPAVKPPST